MRVVLLILIAIADWWGFAAGMVLLLVLLFTTKPIVGRGYMYPVWPFNKEALSRLFIRKPINRDNS